MCLISGVVRRLNVCADGIQKSQLIFSVKIDFFDKLGDLYLIATQKYRVKFLERKLGTKVLFANYCD